MGVAVRETRQVPTKRRRQAFPAVLVCVWFLAAGCQSLSPLPEPEPRTPPPLELPHAEPAELEYFIYHVQAGDTLFALGRRFGVSWQEILETNDHLKSETDLKVGMVLLIRRMPGVEPSRFVPAVAPEHGEWPRLPVSVSKLHKGDPNARFWWPTSGRVLRGYGERLRGLPEPGVAILAPAGQEVCAVAAGQVVTCLNAGRTPESGWGNVVAVSHDSGFVSWYAQLDRIITEKGKRVTKGEPIGTVGSTGRGDQPQLAFRIFRNERPVDPEDYLP